MTLCQTRLILVVQTQQDNFLFMPLIQVVQVVVLRLRPAARSHPAQARLRPVARSHPAQARLRPVARSHPAQARLRPVARSPVVAHLRVVVARAALRLHPVRLNGLIERKIQEIGQIEQKAAMVGQIEAKTQVAMRIESK